MELEFDNEIDALLRKEAAARTITIGEFAGVHLDADEIAAFVENAVPERTRNTFIDHFASCDNCRKALSHAAVLHAETPGLSDSIVAPAAAASVPWYRRLFLFPNLAYVMGGLIVVFAGFIGLSVYNSRSAQGVVSKAVPQAESPAIDLDRSYPANANAEPMMSANTAANAGNAMANAEGGTTSSDVASNSTALRGPSPEGGADDGRAEPAATPAPPPAAPAKEGKFVVDGIDAKRIEKLPVAGRSVQDLPKDRNKAEEQKAPVTMMPSAENSRNSQATQLPAPKATGPYAQRNDNRINEQRSNVQLSRDREADSALKSAAKKKTDAPVAASRPTAPADRKQVGGKTFVFRQGAWYDSVYSGQGTTNVRRRSSDYKKLDSGLRGIAESIIGTVVTVWNGKAYRID